ncbi:carbonic anhydrase [Martelella sp. HB161492]|uniref:carbonic anhydrase n=1 Tax=Martelella sp. HB161492 TaxID=2720726 RepID=UPI001592065D|nr:carbonic anhydrase [Martelella sp. HB161492]
MCENCTTSIMSRRGLLTGSIALSLAAPFAARALAQDMSKSEMMPPASPEEALQRLTEGNSRYAAGTPNNTDHSAARYSRSQGQQPFAAIVSCSDSRVVPELIFDQAPGDIFVVRVAGNFLNDDGIASLEYAAAVLGIQAILVLGHTSCGAVDATIKSIKGNELPPGHLPSLVNAIRPAVYDVMGDSPPDLLAAATAENARLNAAKAASTGPILSDFAASGKIKSYAGVYDIATGKVALL